jgi:predicted AAA+ superfamily ATPase
MLARHMTGRLLKSLGQFPAVALLGPRQVGKTTLTKSVARTWSSSLYLDLESPEDLLKLSDPAGYLGRHEDKLVIIDEIQRSPELFMVLRGLIDRNREDGRAAGQFLLLGSASMDLLRQSSESLAGRISYLDMSGLNLLEVGEEKMLASSCGSGAVSSIATWRMTTTWPWAGWRP